MENSKDLAGKVAVVTGASSGIGCAIARDLSSAGMKVVVTARREKLLQRLRDQLRGEAIVVAADISSPETPKLLLDAAITHFGRADVLVNNAGILVAGGIEDIDLEKLTLMTKVNFDAVVRSSYLFARHFKNQGEGSIINISSIGAYLSHSSMAVYGGLKQALETVTTALRVELKDSGVRVSSIAPGTTETEIFDGLRQEGRAVPGDQSTSLDPMDVAAAVRFALQQPGRANVARMLLVSSSESA